MARILLINPNRYTEPPVPPLGLEYLAAALEGASHYCRLLDLTFAADTDADVRAAVDDCGPDLAGITVRNIDSAICHNNLFFLDEIAAVVELLDSLGVPVVAGGAGFSFAPEEIIQYLGARWGVDGPAEGVLPGLLDSLDNGDPPGAGSVLDGWSDPGWLAGDSSPARSSEGVDYERYLGEGAVGGFRTQTGCRGACPFCAEAGRKVVFRQPRAVVRELEAMAEGGVRKFHLCDSEFNQDLDYCHSLLAEMERARLGFDWALYMRTAPFDRELFRGLADTGASLVTLTYPSGAPDEPARAARAISLAKEYGVRVAVDYLCGFPGQTPDEVGRELDTLRRAEPDTVGVSNCIRLYSGTGVARKVMSDPRWRTGLLGEVDGNPGLLKPVFYCGIPLEELKGLVGSDPLFKIEGFERSSNYQRFSS
ncbi:MAG: radical SAM protein [Candidatus Glassbacteria bacterium]|nr:radical SAM protein [Candidatus Glassbacteria bacterium]